MLLLSLCWIACAGVASAAFADNLEGFFEKRRRLDRSTREKLEDIDAVRLLKAKQARTLPLGSSDELEGVVQTQLLWPQQTIRVCFMDGDTSKWAEIAELVPLWTQNTSAKFDFDLTPGKCNSDNDFSVRVSFRGGAHYSEVGTKARYLPRNLSTVTLGGLGGSAPLTDEEKGTVLHEFGHVLGFEHEHQGPSVDCDKEIQWDYIYANYGPPSLVDPQIRSFLGTGNMTGIYASSFDPKSVMMYYLPRDAFIHPDNSRCFIGAKNNTLSLTDRATVKRFYQK